HGLSKAAESNSVPWGCYKKAHDCGRPVQLLTSATVLLGGSHYQWTLAASEASRTVGLGATTSLPIGAADRSVAVRRRIRAPHTHPMSWNPGEIILWEIDRHSAPR